MWIRAAFWLLLLNVSINGCVAQMPCCQMLMAPSTIYVQINPNEFESQEQLTTPPTRFDQSQVYANYLQWMIMSSPPRTQESNVYYALNTPLTSDQPTSQPRIDQPAFYFMPNWNKMQQPVDINSSPGFVQLQSPVLPSANPAFQIVHHSYPPPPSDAREAIRSQEAQELAPTTSNEHPDMLTQNAKNAQNLLLEIHRQLQHLNNLHSTPETPRNRIEEPLTKSSSTERAAFERPSQQSPIITNHAPNSRASSLNNKSTKDAVDENGSFKQRTPTSINWNSVEEEEKHSLHDNQWPKSADYDDEFERRRSAAQLSREHRFEFSEPRSYNLASGPDRWRLVLSALILIFRVFLD